MSEEAVEEQLGVYDDTYHDLLEVFIQYES